MPTALEKLSIIDPKMAEELNKILKLAQDLAANSQYLSVKYPDAIRRFVKDSKEFDRNVENLLLVSPTLATRLPTEVIYPQLKVITRRLRESTDDLFGSDNLVLANAQLAEDLKTALWDLFKENLP